MNRMIAVSFTALSLMAAAPVFAQDVEPPAVEVSLIPAGGTFFTAKGSSPDFGNYTYGGAIAVNLSRFVGVEGEIGGSAGIAQDLALTGGTSNLKTPNTLNYTGNIVVSAATGGSLVPFVTGGIGGLTMFERQELGIPDKETFLTGNIGGGLKWFAPNGRWGVRGDYRFITVKSKDNAPAFFGPDTRYGHRVYVGLVINALR
jgi:hypothetical protein